MSRLGAFCLCLGLALPIFAEEPSKPTAEEPAQEWTSVPWYRRLFLGERPKPIAPAPTTVAKAPKAPPKQTKESIARLLAEEQKVYLQRLAAITKLRQVANETDDKEMLKKADELERQAEEVYSKRTANLQGGRSADDDLAALERSTDERPATADKNTRRRSTRGDNR